MTPEEAKTRADRAKELLGDPLLKDSFSLAHEAIIQAIRVAKSEQEAFKAAIALQTYHLIRDSISTHIETGKIIEYNFQEPKKRFGLF